MKSKLTALATLFAAGAFTATAAPVNAPATGDGAKKSSHAKSPRLVRRPSGHGEGKFSPEFLCSNDPKYKHALHGCGAAGAHHGTCSAPEDHAKSHACGKAKDPSLPLGGVEFQKKYGDPDKYLAAAGAKKSK